MRVARPGDGWPELDGRPLAPLCQINCAELPIRPETLVDVDLRAIFIHPDRLPVDTPARNGTGWLLRAYSDRDELVALDQPGGAGAIRPFPAAWSPLDADYPSWVDAPASSDDSAGGDEPRLENVHRSKVGGWPSFIQGGSSDDWARRGLEYVLQIDSEEKARWEWGDAGTGYVLRGLGDRRAEWYLDWECY